MFKYALLISPNFQRVCFSESERLIELEISSSGVLQTMTCVFRDIASNRYLILSGETELSALDIEKISRCSFLQAIFEVKDDAFYPIKKSLAEFLPQSLSSMMKYSGKTNELFTRLLINLGVNALSNKKTDRNLRLFDPIAGKGTTLFEGLSFGFDVYGTEVGVKPTQETYQFLKKYLEMSKLKHSPSVEKKSGANKCFTGKKYEIIISKSKDSHERPRIFQIFDINSEFSSELFKKYYFDLIVGDLPYGVQHSFVTNEKQSAFTRSPELLLKRALPALKTVLADWGVMAFSWNANVLSRNTLIDIFDRNELTVFNDYPFNSFSHRVDASIVRDVIVAKKKID